MALIIVEGADCTGKSTIVRSIQRALADQRPGELIETWHAGPPTKPSLKEYEAPLVSYRPGTGRHLILDRWHWGERVYPLVLKRSSDLDEATWLHLELFMQSRGGRVLHLTDTTERLRACLETRGDDLITPDMLAMIRLRFLQVERDAFTLAHRFSGGSAFWLRDDLRERVIGNVVADALHRDDQVKKLNDFVTYVGPPDPEVLLLGDVRGGDPATHALKPAFLPSGTSSGRYLLDAIAFNCEPHVTRFGIANACDVDDPFELWLRLGKPTAIALGENAFQKTGHFAHRVHHPQYARRFTHHRQAEYAKSILTAIEGGRKL